jgi:predicted Fe-Mo cluster-binding NifX family protein
MGEKLRKMRRIAVATADGGHDVQRFGHATLFAVYELAGGEPRLVETRGSMPACGSAPGRHEERLQRAAAVIGDCDVVIVKEIGPGATAVLQRRGLQVCIGSGTVANGLQTLLAGRNNKATLPHSGDPT